MPPTPTNTTARKLRILIGSDTQDWSEALGSLVVGRDAVSENGLLASTGRLTLQENLTNPEAINPVLNAARWRPGQPLQVQIANDSGAFISHPHGALFILKEARYSQRSRILTVQVGDWLAWGLSAEPADDVSAVVLGASTNLATVAQRYLEAADIPSGQINLGSWPYAIASPVPKADNTPYVQLAGAIAYANDYRSLYVDASGTVRSLALDTVTGTPDLTLDIATEELLYDPDPDTQEPFETIRVAGNGVTIAPVTTPDDDTQSTPDTELFTSESHLLSVTELLGPNGNIVPVTEGDYVRRRTQRRFRQAKSQVVAGSTSSTQILVDDTVTLRYYDATQGAPYPLVYVFRYTEQAQSIFDPNSPSDDAPRRIIEETENYTYDAERRCIRIAIDEWQREDLTDPDGGITRRLVRKDAQDWVNEGSELWAYERVEEQSRILNDPSAEFANDTEKWQRVQLPTSEKKPAAGRGENAPPAPEEWLGPYRENESTYEGEATWVHRGGATGRNRTRPPFQLPQGLAFSNAQCVGIAGLIRDLLDGRKQGVIIQLPINDALLALDRPLFQLQVTETSGRVATYLCDAVTWEHRPDRAYVECAGILIADSLYP